jgi:hypothetical protein
MTACDFNAREVFDLIELLSRALLRFKRKRLSLALTVLLFRIGVVWNWTMA